MKKYLPIILLFAFFVLTGGCSKTGTIECTVIDRLTKQPIEGATVTVEGTQLSAQTDSKGFCKIKGVVPGQQKIFATKEGYDKSQVISLAVAKGATSKPVPLEIECVSESCAEAYNVRARGRILDLITNSPIQGAVVSVSKNNTTLTDSNGSFLLKSLLPRRKYTVFCRKTGYSDYSFVFRSGSLNSDFDSGTKFMLRYPPRKGVFVVYKGSYVELPKFVGFKKAKGKNIPRHPWGQRPDAVIYINNKDLETLIKRTGKWLIIYGDIGDSLYITPLVYSPPKCRLPKGFYCGITCYVVYYKTYFRFLQRWKLRDFPSIRGKGLTCFDISKLPSGKYILCNFGHSLVFKGYSLFGVDYTRTKLFGFLFDKK